MFKTALEISTCNREKCKKEFEELQKYKDGVLSKLSELRIKESETTEFNDYKQKAKLLTDEFNNKKGVIEYLENLKNAVKKNAEPDKKILNNFIKESKIYNKDLKKILKNYHKTEIGKYYMKESEKMLKELSHNVKTIPLAECSYKECIELHKKGLQTIKKLVHKLCDEKVKRSCKILKAIDKMDFDKINFKKNMKLKKMLEKGFV